MRIWWDKFLAVSVSAALITSGVPLATGFSIASNTGMPTQTTGSGSLELALAEVAPIPLAAAALPATGLFFAQGRLQQDEGDGTADPAEPAPPPAESPATTAPAASAPPTSPPPSDPPPPSTPSTPSTPPPAPTYTLTTLATVGGTVTASVANLTTGQTAQVTATANPGYKFANWSGTATSALTSSATDPRATVRIGATNLTLTANFIPVYTLTTAAGAGGTVTASVANLTTGQTAQVTATANPGYKFANWSGTATSALTSSATDPRATVRIGATNLTLTANFVPIYRLETQAGLGGTVSGSLNELANGQTVTVTATPNPGYMFTEWTVTGARLVTAKTDPSALIEMGAGNATVRANFTQIRFTIVASGDVLVHSAVYNAARIKGGYDFGYMFAGLDPWVKGADLALCNMEVPIVPPGQKLSSFPRFAVPSEVVRDLGRHGWDGCSTATNHTVDKGLPGVVETLRIFDGYKMGAVGSARSATEANEPQLYRLKRGNQTITVAHLAMTWSTNGLPRPTAYAVQMLDNNRIINQARAARRAGADLVIVSLHAGTEYTTKLNATQTSSTAALAKSGAMDLVIGNHPHVGQRIQKLAGGPDGRGMWVAYSLGNLISAQTQAPRSTGLLLYADIVSTGNGARVEGVQWTPIVTDRRMGYRVTAIQDDLAKPGATKYTAAELRSRRSIEASAVAGGAPERTKPPTPTGPGPEVVRRKR